MDYMTDMFTMIFPNEAASYDIVRREKVLLAAAAAAAACSCHS